MYGLILVTVSKKKNYDNELIYLLGITASVLILLLSLFNLKHSSKKNVEVLGTSIESTYWEDLLTKYPTYIDGWVEIGRMDKVKEIDPNYILN